MYKGGRLQNSIWEFFLHVTFGNKKYAKCDHQQANTAARIKVHYTKCSMDSVYSASTERKNFNLGNIHSKVCNLLCNSKTFKLIFCYRILRGSVELDN